MAKWWYAAFIFINLSIVTSYSSAKRDGTSFYHYKTDSMADNAVDKVQLRLKRDVAATPQEISTKPAEQVTTIAPDAQKKAVDNTKKTQVDKFPDTKKPMTEKPSKGDKYNKKKPMLGKPEENPFIKPLNDSTTSADTNSGTTFYSSNVVNASSSSVPPDLAAATTTTTSTTASISSTASSTVTTVSSTTASTEATASSTAAVNNNSSNSWPLNNSNGSVDDNSSDDDWLATEDDSPADTSQLPGFQNNLTEFDHHRYYDSYTFSGDEMKEYYWVKLDERPDTHITESRLLSSAYRQAYTLALPFEFPFYGEQLRNITIATGGFLYTGDLLHIWLAATQYIAPLMANFDTSASKNSTVKYGHNETSLTVQWENVKLKGKPDGGAFTFQVTIHQSGDIVFSYKDVPVAVDMIDDQDHPVKVGLSDAYVVQKTIFYVRRKTIYEYHKINLKKPSKVSNWTAILFKALPTCVSFNDCHSCITHNTTFKCQWCEKVMRCSDGMDRHRHDWLINRCDFINTEHPEQCIVRPAVVQRMEAVDAPPNTQAITAAGEEAEKEVTSESIEPWIEEEKLVAEATTDGDEGGSGVGAGVTIAVLLCLVLVVGGWVVYAYFYPHTSSGQLLIKYRPRTWSFKRGGAHYTAAAMHSIHM